MIQAIARRHPSYWPSRWSLYISLALCWSSVSATFQQQCTRNILNSPLLFDAFGISKFAMKRTKYFRSRKINTDTRIQNCALELWATNVPFGISHGFHIKGLLMMARWVAARLITISELGFKRPFHLTSHSTFFFCGDVQRPSVLNNSRIFVVKKKSRDRHNFVRVGGLREI